MNNQNLLYENGVGKFYQLILPNQKVLTKVTFGQPSWPNYMTILVDNKELCKYSNPDGGTCPHDNNTGQNQVLELIGQHEQPGQPIQYDLYNVVVRTTTYVRIEWEDGGGGTRDIITEIFIY